MQSHTLGTAAVLAELGASQACVSAALLHGVQEQGSSPSAELQSLSADVAMHVSNAARIADLSQVCYGVLLGILQAASIRVLTVLRVVQIVNQNRGQTDEATRQQFSRMLLGMADIPALLVHLADRLQVLPSAQRCPDRPCVPWRPASGSGPSLVVT